MLPRRALLTLSTVAVASALATFAASGLQAATTREKVSGPKAFRATIRSLAIKRDPFAPAGHAQTVDEIRVRQLERAVGQGDFARILPLPPNLGATMSLIPSQGLDAALQAGTRSDTSVIGTILGPRGRYALLASQGSRILIWKGARYQGTFVLSIALEQVKLKNGVVLGGRQP